MISRMASQNSGTDMPAKAERLMMLSASEPGRAAACTPAGMAMASAMTRLMPMSRTVFQSRGVSTCQTGSDCSRE